MLITLPLRVETTWPQPTPQKGQTVVVSVAPRVLSGGIAAPLTDGDKAPIATVPVVSPLRSWRRVGCGGSVCAAALPRSRLTLSSSAFFIVVSRVQIADDLVRSLPLRERQNNRPLVLCGAAGQSVPAAADNRGRGRGLTAAQQFYALAPSSPHHRGLLIPHR